MPVSIPKHRAIRNAQRRALAGHARKAGRGGGRARILAAASELFGAKGFSDVSMQDVAERGQSEVARQLSTRSLEEVPALLEETPRDPLVERFWDLPPTERVRAVGAARS